MADEFEMWHYKMGESRISKEKSWEIVMSLPPVDGAFVGFRNEKGEGLQMMVFGQDEYLLDIPTSSTDPDDKFQTKVTRNRMFEVFKTFLEGGDWIRLCKWQNWRGDCLSRAS